MASCKNDFLCTLGLVTDLISNTFHLCTHLRTDAKGFSGGRYTVSDNNLGLSKDVFEQCTLTGNGFFLFLSGGFAQMFGQVTVSARVKTLYKMNFEVSRHI